MANNQTQNWTAATFTSQGLPAPSGSNENGEPYWIDDKSGEKISWDQMQQAVWAQRQKQQGGGRGFEGAPMMPVANFELPTAPEQQIERPANPEKRESQERRGENAIEQNIAKPATNQQVQSPKPQKKKASSLIGQSAPLKKVDTTDPESMFNHIQSNTKNKDIKSSDAFLKTIFEKILSQLVSSAANK